jgi:hypothetical protein
MPIDTASQPAVHDGEGCLRVHIKGFVDMSKFARSSPRSSSG